MTRYLGVNDVNPIHFYRSVELATILNNEKKIKNYPFLNRTLIKDRYNARSLSIQSRGNKYEPTPNFQKYCSEGGQEKEIVLICSNGSCVCYF
jgi:hypothetical protein